MRRIRLIPNVSACSSPRSTRSRLRLGLMAVTGLTARLRMLSTQSPRSTPCPGVFYLRNSFTRELPKIRAWPTMLSSRVVWIPYTRSVLRSGRSVEMTAQPFTVGASRRIRCSWNQRSIIVRVGVFSLLVELASSSSCCKRSQTNLYGNGMVYKEIADHGERMRWNER